MYKRYVHTKATSERSPTRIEALIVLGNKLCMPVSKKSVTCELSHILMPSINSSFLLKLCDPSQFFR
jgi:hypothetical protein